MKSRKEMLDKLGIEALNEMQEQAALSINTGSDVVLLSPTGTGKTLAFLLPLIQRLNSDIDAVQVLIVVPSRELAIQIEQVCREMGSGFKVNAVYGGQAGAKDKANLQHPPAILIGTPGRLADHLGRNSFATDHLSVLVLDEFDKSLETGFEEQMTLIVEALPKLSQRILTSATNGVEVPQFISLRKPLMLDFLEEHAPRLQLYSLEVPRSEMLTALLQILKKESQGRGIVFCNFKDSIGSVAAFLEKHGVDFVAFYGGLEQQDRERALIKFRNGSSRVLLATDLAARGIDVPALDYIIHYELPIKAEEFVHRNGRTARMHESGVAYVLKWKGRDLPEFMEDVKALSLTELPQDLPVAEWRTMFVSGGRRDKISKGDIAGWCFRKGGLKNGELGDIELKQECAFVAVRKTQADRLAKLLDQSRLKKRKVRVKLI